MDKGRGGFAHDGIVLKPIDIGDPEAMLRVNKGRQYVSIGSHLAEQQTHNHPPLPTNTKITNNLALQGSPGFFQPLDRDRHGGAQFLGKQGHAQFLQHPAEVPQAAISRTFQRRHGTLVLRQQD